MQLRLGWLCPIRRSDPCPANRCSSVALDGLRGPAGMRTYTRSRRTRPGHPAPAPLRYSSHGGCCIEEVEKMTGKTITELALDAIDQALAESISAQPGSAVSPVRSGVVSRHRALNNVQIDKRGCIIDGR